MYNITYILYYRKVFKYVCIVYSMTKKSFLMSRAEVDFLFTDDKNKIDVRKSSARLFLDKLKGGARKW